MVCERSPLATAPITRAISVLGCARSSTRSLTASAPFLLLVAALVAIYPFLPSFLPIDSLFSLQAQWYPELELRAGPRLACDVEPAAGELRPLANGDQADVAGQARGFGDDEAFAVVSDFDPYAVLDAIGDDCDPGRASVLLDVVKRFLDVLQDDRLDRGRDAVRQLALDVGLDAGADSHRLETLADRFAEVTRQLQRLRAHVREQAPQRVLDLAEGHP